MLDAQKEQALVNKGGDIVRSKAFLLPRAAFAFSKFCLPCKIKITEMAKLRKIVVMEEYCERCQAIAKKYLGGLK